MWTSTIMYDAPADVTPRASWQIRLTLVLQLDIRPKRLYRNNSLLESLELWLGRP